MATNFPADYTDMMRIHQFGSANWEADPLDQYGKVELATAGYMQ